MELNIDNLAIEVTRKCNMKCEHCLRGPAQRKTIPNNYIYKILQLIDNVSTLNITGGEPTLAMESLHQIRNCVIYGNADVQNFYMVTNGKSINIDDLAEWAQGMLACCAENELSSISFSFDQFHTETLNCKQANKQQRNFYNLQEKLNYDYGISETPCGDDFIRKHSDDSWGYHSLIKQGRAKDFGTRDNDIEIFEIDIYEPDDIFSINETTLYLSCNGYIVAGCDWSYHNIDNNKDIRIGHIEDINCTDQLIEAIQAYNEKAKKHCDMFKISIK